MNRKNRKCAKRAGKGANVKETEVSEKTINSEAPTEEVVEKSGESAEIPAIEMAVQEISATNEATATEGVTEVIGIEKVSVAEEKHPADEDAVEEPLEENSGNAVTQEGNKNETVVEDAGIEDSIAIESVQKTNNAEDKNEVDEDDVIIPESDEEEINHADSTVGGAASDSSGESWGYFRGLKGVEGESSKKQDDGKEENEDAVQEEPTEEPAVPEITLCPLCKPEESKIEKLKADAEMQFTKSKDYCLKYISLASKSTVIFTNILAQMTHYNPGMAETLRKKAVAEFELEGSSGAEFDYTDEVTKWRAEAVKYELQAKRAEKELANANSKIQKLRDEARENNGQLILARIDLSAAKNTLKELQESTEYVEVCDLKQEVKDLKKTVKQLENAAGKGAGCEGCNELNETNRRLSAQLKKLEKAPLKKTVCEECTAYEIKVDRLSKDVKSLQNKLKMHPTKIEPYRALRRVLTAAQPFVHVLLEHHPKEFDQSQKLAPIVEIESDADDDNVDDDSNPPQQQEGPLDLHLHLQLNSDLTFVSCYYGSLNLVKGGPGKPAGKPGQPALDVPARVVEELALRLVYTSVQMIPFDAEDDKGNAVEVTPHPSLFGKQQTSGVYVVYPTNGLLLEDKLLCAPSDQVTSGPGGNTTGDVYVRKLSENVAISSAQIRRGVKAIFPHLKSLLVKSKSLKIADGLKKELIDLILNGLWPEACAQIIRKHAGMYKRLFHDNRVAVIGEIVELMVLGAVKMYNQKYRECITAEQVKLFNNQLSSEIASNFYTHVGKKHSTVFYRVLQVAVARKTGQEVVQRLPLLTTAMKKAQDLLAGYFKDYRCMPPSETELFALLNTMPTPRRRQKNVEEAAVASSSEKVEKTNKSTPKPRAKAQLVSEPELSDPDSNTSEDSSDKKLLAKLPELVTGHESDDVSERNSELEESDKDDTEAEKTSSKEPVFAKKKALQVVLPKVVEESSHLHSSESERTTPVTSEEEEEKASQEEKFGKKKASDDEEGSKNKEEEPQKKKQRSHKKKKSSKKDESDEEEESDEFEVKNKKRSHKKKDKKKKKKNKKKKKHAKESKRKRHSRSSSSSSNDDSESSSSSSSDESESDEEKNMPPRKKSKHH